MADKIQKIKMLELADKYDLSLIILFGSRARSNNHLTRDIDVAYLAITPLTLRDEARLATELVPLLGKNIDLVNIAGASPLLAQPIFKPQDLDKRRKMMGLSNFSYYKKKLEKNYRSKHKNQKS